MKQLFFRTMLILFAFILTNCQKDDTAQIEEVSENNMSINYVSGEKIPNIINLLGDDNGASSKSSSSKSNTISAPFGTISIESILEVIDTTGNQNYSFTLVPKTPKPNSIFNLVINSSNGSTNMAIMEYRMAPDFAQEYHTGLKTFSEFTGNIFTFPFNPNSSLFAKGDTCIQNIDEVVDCNRITLQRGRVLPIAGGGASVGPTTLGSTNTYSGAYAGGINHNYGGATTGESNDGSYVHWVCTCGNSHPDPSYCTCTTSSGGPGSLGADGTWIVQLIPDANTNKSSNTKKGGDCCDGTDVNGSIGVNLLAAPVDYITNCIPDLTTEQIDFLNGSLQSFAIKTFLEENKNPDESCNEDASSFANLAIQALVDGEISSFEDAKNIIETNFTPNTDNTDKIDPNEELKCFDLTKGAKLTIYVQQPKENSSQLVGPNEVGHAFIGIEQSGITRQLGFYPESGASDGLVAVGKEYDSELRDNYDYLYHVSVSLDISNSQLTTIKNYINNFPEKYDVNDYACTDFAIKIGNLGGMNLPSTTVTSWPFKGRSPGQLGQEIRAMNSDSTKTIKKIKENSPNKEGECD